MASTTTNTETRAPAAVEQDQCVVLAGIGWEGYQTMLRLRRKRRPRMIYLDGDLWLVSPGFTHEWVSRRLDQFAATVMRILKIRYEWSGSTTFWIEEREAGVEPDGSFYIAHHASLEGKKDDIRLPSDPPPDLVIEAVFSNPVSRSLEAYKRFGVPEVWLGYRDRLRILVLQPDGEYADSDRSDVLPFLTHAEISAWIYQEADRLEPDWIDALIPWVQEELLPRHQDQPPAE